LVERTTISEGNVNSEIKHTTSGGQATEFSILRLGHQSSHSDGLMAVAGISSARHDL
jgi:hypothetical protein